MFQNFHARIKFRPLGNVADSFVPFLCVGTQGLNHLFWFQSIQRDTHSSSKGNNGVRGGGLEGKYDALEKAACYLMKRLYLRSGCGPLFNALLPNKSMSLQIFGSCVLNAWPSFEKSSCPEIWENLS